MNDAFSAALGNQLAIDCLAAASAIARDFPGLHPKVSGVVEWGTLKGARIILDSWAGRGCMEFPPGMPLAEIERGLKGLAEDIERASAGMSGRP